jgi:hypothetical protein
MKELISSKSPTVVRLFHVAKAVAVLPRRRMCTMCASDTSGASKLSERLT